MAIGVTVGRVSPYTLDLCLCMLLFHLGLMAIKDRPRLLRTKATMKLWPVVCGGTVMLLTFLTFRIGLQEVQASYASVRTAPVLLPFFTVPEILRVLCRAR